MNYNNRNIYNVYQSKAKAVALRENSGFSSLHTIVDSFISSIRISITELDLRINIPGLLLFVVIISGLNLIIS